MNKKKKASYDWDDKELVSKQTKKRIWKWVLIGHITTLLLLAASPLLADLFKKPKPKQMFVAQVIELPPAPSPAPDPKPVAPDPTPAPPPPLAKPIVQPPVKTPPVVKKAVVEPKKSVKPPIKKKKIKKTVKKKEPPKITKKKNTKAKKQVKKEKKKKKWEPRKTINFKRRTDTKRKPVVNTPKFDANNFLKNVKTPTQNVRKTSNVATNKTSDRDIKKFHANVGDVIRRNWQEPKAAELGGRFPTVKVFIEFNSKGKVISTRIVSKSNIRAMDQSVQAALNRIKQLPDPPAGERRITIELTVDM